MPAVLAALVTGIFGLIIDVRNPRSSWVDMANNLYSLYEDIKGELNEEERNKYITYLKTVIHDGISDAYESRSRNRAGIEGILNFFSSMQRYPLLAYGFITIVVSLVVMSVPIIRDITAHDEIIGVGFGGYIIGIVITIIATIKYNKCDRN